MNKDAVFLSRLPLPHKENNGNNNSNSIYPADSSRDMVRGKQMKMVGIVSIFDGENAKYSLRRE